MLCLLVKHPWIEWHSHLYKQNEFKSQQRVGRWKSGRLKASIFHLIGKEPEPRKKTDSSGRQTAFLESFGELGRWNYLWRFAGEEWRRGGSSGGNRSQCGQLRMMGDSCRKRERERERQSPSEIKEKPKWKTEKERFFFFFFFFFKSSWEEVTPVSMREKQVQS